MSRGCISVAEYDDSDRDDDGNRLRSASTSETNDDNNQNKTGSRGKREVKKVRLPPPLPPPILFFISYKDNTFK